MARGARQITRSFVGGEMAPQMFARQDDPRFLSGAGRLENMTPLPQGPARKRRGFRLVREVKRNWYTAASVSAADDELTLTITHDIETGDPVTVKSSGTMPAPLVAGTTYYAIDSKSNGIKLATTNANALAGTAIDITSAGTGSIWVFAPNKKKVRLIPFRFGTEDTLCLEIGRAIVDSREIGYIRFHKDGATVTYPAPAAYVEPKTITNLAGGTGKFTATGHGLETGDPIVLTMPSAYSAGFQAVTFTAATSEVNWAGHGLFEGQQCAFQTNDTLPPELVAGRLYYTKNLGDPDKFAVSATRFGPDIVFSSAGTGPHTITVMPVRTAGASNIWVDVFKLFWAIKDDANTFRIALSQGEAIGGDALVPTNLGTNNSDIRVHKDYRNGVKVDDGNGKWVCISPPWVDHTGHAPPDTDYWMRLPEGPDILEMPHFWTEDALFELQYFQSLDVLTICHPDRPATELRRFNDSSWQMRDAPLNAGLPAPLNAVATIFGGEGMTISAVDATTKEVTLSSNHTFIDGEVVMVTGCKNSAGTVLIADAHYVIETVSASTTKVKLHDFENGNVVTPVAGTPVITARMRPAPFASSWSSTYKITALEAETGTESPASLPVTVINNLLNPGAYNTLTWDAVTGADRYRVYKEEFGIFGLVGEVEGTPTFRDENVAPDLSRSLQMRDDALYRTAEVTFPGGDLVSWPGHGIHAGDPVIFTTTLTLPAGLTREQTYYAVNVSEDSFQVVATPGGSVVTITGAGTGFHTARAGRFPAAGCYFEGRRCFGGPHTLPHGIWLTVSGTESDLRFSLPVQDSDRIHFALQARKSARIRHMLPLAHLLVLTHSTEYRITPLNTDALAPSSIAARAPTHIGAGAATPETVNNTALFVADRGARLREMGVTQEVADYVTGDISIRAQHLFDGFTISQIAYVGAPVPLLLCVSSSGLLLSLTYAPEEGIGGWGRITTAGTFESVAAIAEGDVDTPYVVVRRSIQGAQIRFVERMAKEAPDLATSVYVDSALTYSGAPTTTVSGLTHLEGMTVSILADGIALADQVVSGGQITLATAASEVVVGLPYTARVDPLPLVLQAEPALGSARQIAVNHVSLRVIDSGEFQAGPLGGALVDSIKPDAGQTLDGIHQVTILGSWAPDGQVTLQQSRPLPLEVVSVTYDITVGG